MDITLENLDQNVPIIIENIKNSLFLSFDFEFSGLNAHGAPKVNLHDTIQDRYFRAVNSAQNFLPIQFGLTTIAFNDNTLVQPHSSLLLKLNMNLNYELKKYYLFDFFQIRN